VTGSGGARLITSCVVKFLVKCDESSTASRRNQMNFSGGARLPTPGCGGLLYSHRNIYLPENSKTQIRNFTLTAIAQW